MRARTADGHTLQLPDARLGTILPQLHNSGLDDLVRRNYSGDLSRAVARSIGQLANRAHRVGALRSPQTGSRYPVFSSALGGRSFQIVTRPDGAGAGTIVGIRPQAAGSAEYMAAAGQPTLGPRRALTTAAGDATLNVPGVYQIYKDGRLVYVGQAQNVRVRLQQHLLCLTHMAVPPAGYAAAVGPMPSSSRQARTAEERRRIDQNRARPGNSLTNQREFEMMIGDEGEQMNARAFLNRAANRVTTFVSNVGTRIGNFLDESSRPSEPPPFGSGQPPPASGSGFAAGIDPPRPDPRLMNQLTRMAGIVISLQTDTPQMNGERRRNALAAAVRTFRTLYRQATSAGLSLPPRVLEAARLAG